ncbi:MerR family transcriptional regulator [Spongiactinospora sp. TRM90649]|uniref:MerR family transcriptional regulator n=1 Tax=Spongiactinospora sp. TRM90649 TaxID=3031114 RepID=UPI0023F92E35|nr:MerR family transcriptional regulator [Spongiactinospora sp. TRM90649]MDF5757899.1 MerR family transcriptional regulator [Spongiactinospora sp. TRM90649]
MITIGRLAAYAGVTIKAVRHYHRLGLLEEPPRDASGYRRYDAGHAVRLIEIRTLAEAGVPLARVKAMLAADPEGFAAAVAEIDRALARRVEELLRVRERVAALGAGDRLFVSADVAGYLERLSEIGVSDRAVRMERDVWILLQSVSPVEAAVWIEDKLDAIEDPEFRAIYLGYDAAFDWSPDDPRLPELAERARRWTQARYDGSRLPVGDPTPSGSPPPRRARRLPPGSASPNWRPGAGPSRPCDPDRTRVGTRVGTRTGFARSGRASVPPGGRRVACTVGPVRANPVLGGCAHNDATAGVASTLHRAMGR